MARKGKSGEGPKKDSASEEEKCCGIVGNKGGGCILSSPLPAKSFYSVERECSLNDMCGVWFRG